jgi:hypothetical protein
MTPENHNIPDWLHQEHQANLAWIEGNLDLFWTIATAAFEEAGRGAIIVDTKRLLVPGTGNPFAYFSQDVVEEHCDEHIRYVVAEYDPTHEFALVLLKPGTKPNIYWVGIGAPESQETVATEVAPSHAGEPSAELKLDVPDLETLMEWEAEGGCEAVCPHHCWVEPDGVCPHGNPSWLLKLGLI